MAKNNNILLLVADDLGKYLGCYGEHTIHTPHIDKLASQGAVFDMAFTSTASCSASRSVIYSGLHTHENGQYGLNNNRHHFTTFDHIETAPKVLGNLGYLTGIIGKVHVGPESVYPWEVREESGSRDVAWVADRAEAFFSRAKEADKPFFLTVGYIDPHRDLTRSGFGNTDELTDPRIHPASYTPADVSIPVFLSDVPEVREELAEYYQSIHRLDQGVGLILAALETEGLADDTMVVFISDNGPPFVNSKTTLYDAGIRLPLVIRRPGGTSSWTGRGILISKGSVRAVHSSPLWMNRTDWKDGTRSLAHIPSMKSPTTGQLALCEHLSSSITVTLPGSSTFHLLRTCTAP